MSTEAARSQMEFSILPELVEGKELHLFLSGAPSSSMGHVALTCTIVKAFRPFTLSPVLLVSLVQPFTSPYDHVSLPVSAVLKLYDRRCLVNTRDNFDEGKPWSLDKELEYRRYHTTQKLFNAELTTYERLRALQGKKIPKLHGVVEYEERLRRWIRRHGEHPRALARIRPVLKTLATRCDLDGTRPAAAEWSPDDVVRGSSQGRRSRFRLRMDNFLMREPFVTSSSHGEDPAVVEDPVMLVDLAQCRLRREDEGEEEWVEAKRSQDETGAVGFVVLGLVCKFVGDDVWTYERSSRYYRPPEWLATVVLPPGLTIGGSVLSKGCACVQSVLDTGR